MSSKLFAGLAALGVLLGAAEARAQFSYSPPGELVSGSGTGRADETVYAPGIRFPLEEGPAFLNSQVWGHGGNSGPGGSQCDGENFSYPWWDNYCETRSWDMPLCPSGTGHQGQDIRAASCDKDTYWAVAITDGTITNIGSYSVYLTTADGTRFDYLHMSTLQVSVGETVTRGQRMGLVSNQFGGSATTVHLHFNIRQNVSGYGSVYVPPYMSLVAAYETLLGVSGSGGSGGSTGVGGSGATGGDPGVGGSGATGGDPGVGGSGFGGSGATGGDPGVGGSGFSGSGGTGFGGSGATGGDPGVGGSGPAPTGCSKAPDCNACTTCMDACLCQTGQFQNCVGACNALPVPEGSGGGSTVAAAAPQEESGCACSTPAPANGRLGFAALPLLFALRRRRRR